MFRIPSSTLSAALVAVAILAGAIPAAAQSQPTGSWANESTGENFYYGGSCTDGTYLYVVGGYQDSTITTVPQYMARFRRYDPVNNTWFEMPAIAAGTATGSALWGHIYNTAAYHNGRIFIFGGYTYTGTVGTANSYTSAGPTTVIRAFTFSTNTWTTLSATMTTGRYYFAAAALGDMIYITGGPSTPTCDGFNPNGANGGTITAMTPMPAYLYYHGMAAVPALNKVYALGGYGVAGYTGINYEYTPQDSDSSTNDVGGTWTTRAPISNGSTTQTLYYVSAMSLNNRVYVPGGYNSQTGVQNLVYEYSPTTNTWAQRATMTYGHYVYHAAVPINGKGYVYGGYPNYIYGEEFTPPSFGSAPNEPTNVIQQGSRAETSLQAQADQNQFDGWTNTQVSFTATVSDPDATQQVRFRVQVKPQAASWTQASAITSLDSGLTAQGTIALNYNIPAGGGYDWRWRVEDTFGNSFPLAANTWVEAYGTAAAANTTSPDFRSDQVVPADPVAVSPSNVDFQVPDPVLGNVVLNWIESTDNGPVAGISYELQVAHDGGFNNVEAQIFSSAGTSSYPITLTVERELKHWRIRARDVGGNFSQWSPPLTFRVTYNDGDNHGGGDAKKGCGMAAFGGPSIIGILMGLALLASAGRRQA